MELSSPPPASSPFHPALCLVSAAYEHFMQKLYRTADLFNQLQRNSSNFPEWVAFLKWLMEISHFLDATLPHDFALCIGSIQSQMTAKDFFDAIKARCCPGNCFQKLKVMHDLLDMLIENCPSNPEPKSTIVLSLFQTFEIFKKLGVKADNIEGLLAQASCHAPPTLDQGAFD
ncbi:hypothetical protein O181_034461 [Austropuccinia psidii MF-1]|uniref:Uncharacterized protein n=1 Tax=Austropuccinia psidii MF-1 TaxID=1389203 RepID=A0A9Q3D0R3_9BASI|nr:hypothetical protein [Austropuccinia psidii MF-1]